VQDFFAAILRKACGSEIRTIPTLDTSLENSMSREKLALCSNAEVESWFKPPVDTIASEHRDRFLAKCAALRAVCLGESNLTSAASDMRLCRKQLRSMVNRAPRLAPDGQPFGFRVCAPWGSYYRQEFLGDGVMPTKAGPHSFAALLAAQPQIKAWVHSYSAPSPPGRPPRIFEKLHKKILVELRRKELHEFYPLNQGDKGRRALLRYIRTRRIETGPILPPDEWDSSTQSKLADIFRGQPFDRMELDGHRIDIETPFLVPLPNGGSVTRSITALWIIPEVECESRAIVSWVLRVGRNYNNQDVTETLAGSMRSWKPRDLIIPDLKYAPGAGMPSSLATPMGLCRGRMIAMDNHKGHHSPNVEDAFCRAHDGILTFGRPHQPRTRPIVEQLNSRLEKGAFRLLPGGFEPATRLGEDKICISDFAPDEHPLQLHLLDELIDVIVANYNATPHPSLGDLSPLQYLQQRSTQALWFYQPSDAETCSADMNSILVSLRVNGNKKTGVLPHVNYAYVRYRSPELDGRWELIGKTLIGRISRNDLRSLVLFRTATQPIGVLRANAPWHQTRHDETTRKLIFQWSKQEGAMSLNGVECAVNAYAKFLKKTAGDSQKAADQLARFQQQHNKAPIPIAPHSLMSTSLRQPKRGWVSMDEMRDS
jgi:transposase InsO family protein